MSETADLAATKACPDCAEQIQSAARVCRFCGHRFDDDAGAGGAFTPAGWYPDPSGQPQQRYWDGRQWTEHYTPSGPGVYPQHPSTQRSGGLTVLGLLMAVFIPVIGFLLGLVLLGRRQDRDGLVVVMVSIAVLVLWYALLRSGG